MGDPTLERISAAVARADRPGLVALWEEITPAGDALHRCVLAHYLADLYPDPAVALIWDVRALDAAAALTDDRAAEAGLTVAGLLPSLHLNLADNLRRLGSFEVAAAELALARAGLDVLADDGYGRLMRAADAHVGEALAARSTERLPTAPGPTSA